MKKSITIVILIAIILVGGVVFVKNSVPLKFEDDIVKYAKQYSVDPGLVASVIHIESNFNENSKYEKGSPIGVMQITDVTAEKWAKEMGIENFDSTTIEQTSVNIQLGTWYLGKLWNEKDSSMKSIAEKWATRNNEEVSRAVVNKYEKTMTKEKGLYKIVHSSLVQ